MSWTASFKLHARAQYSHYRTPTTNTTAIRYLWALDSQTECHDLRPQWRHLLKLIWFLSQPAAVATSWTLSLLQVIFLKGADLLLSFFNNGPFALNSTVCFGSLEKTNAFDVQIGNYRMTAETELIICLVHELSLQLHQHNTGPKVEKMP